MLSVEPGRVSPRSAMASDLSEVADELIEPLRRAECSRTWI